MTDSAPRLCSNKTPAPELLAAYIHSSRAAHSNVGAGSPRCPRRWERCADSCCTSHKVSAVTAAPHTHLRAELGQEQSGILQWQQDTLWPSSGLEGLLWLLVQAQGCGAGQGSGSPIAISIGGA